MIMGIKILITIGVLVLILCQAIKVKMEDGDSK